MATVAVRDHAVVHSRRRLGQTTIEIGGPDFRFSAAHTGLHSGRFEPMHGHTYIPTLTLCGVPDASGMVVDFREARAALRQVVDPLRSRTLLAGNAGAASPACDVDAVRFTDGAKEYLLPAEDVVILPIANTTTEEIAAYLLDQVVSALVGSGVRQVLLQLAESPGTTVTVSTAVSGSGGRR
jgi:6-pyruvoyl-tetrahydropterin synthase